MNVSESFSDKARDYYDQVDREIVQIIIHPDQDTSKCDSDSLLVDELASHITISFYRSGKIFYLNCNKKTILDNDNHTEICKNHNCLFCNLKDTRNSIIVKDVQGFDDLLKTDCLKEFVRGYIEYFMRDQKVAIAFYAPMAYDLTRVVYHEQQIIEECHQGFDSLSKYRQVNFVIQDCVEREPEIALRNSIEKYFKDGKW